LFGRAIRVHIVIELVLARLLCPKSYIPICEVL
jgi:hypothetical protein